MSWVSRPQTSDSIKHRRLVVECRGCGEKRPRFCQRPCRMDQAAWIYGQVTFVTPGFVHVPFDGGSDNLWLVVPTASFPWSWGFSSAPFLLPQSSTDVSLSYLRRVCQKFQLWFVKYFLRKQREFVRFREMRLKITFKVQKYRSHRSVISKGRVSTALVWPARSRKSYRISKHTWSETMADKRPNLRIQSSRVS
jgi:hypothetical protein